MSYDYRQGSISKVSNFDLADKWYDEVRKIREATRKAERAASLRMMREIKAGLDNFGLELDLKTSSVESYKSGSDSYSSSCYLWLKAKPTQDQTAPITAEGVAWAILDVTKAKPKLTDKGNGQYLAVIEWGG